jgi:hypothetical protein
MKWKMTIHDTGKMVSFIDNDTRESVAQLFIDHDVAIMHGVQGDNFFRALYEHLDEMFNIAKYFEGHVLKHHVEIYRGIGLTVDVHHYCRIDDKDFAWVMVSRDG